MIKPTVIPEGAYYTKAQVAEIKGVIVATAQQWIDKGWLKAIQIPGLGYIIHEKDLRDFVPLKPGPRPSSES